MSKTLADLKTSDAHYQEAWLSGGYQADLQALIDATASPGSGSSLSGDAATFNSDASGYLSEAVDGRHARSRLAGRIREGHLGHQRYGHRLRATYRAREHPCQLLTQRLQLHVREMNRRRAGTGPTAG